MSSNSIVNNQKYHKYLNASQYEERCRILRHRSKINCITFTVRRCTVNPPPFIGCFSEKRPGKLRVLVTTIVNRGYNSLFEPSQPKITQKDRTKRNMKVPKIQKKSSIFQRFQRQKQTKRDIKVPKIRLARQFSLIKEAGRGGGTSSKSSFLLFLTEGSVSYQMIFTVSKNIFPSRSYRITVL